MVRGIVAQSDGFIDVQSEPGHGTTFRIYLPAFEGAPSDAERPVSARDLRGKEAVLIVEDQAEVRDYVAAALQTYGYAVFQAAGAEGALRLCEREQGRLDLLLTDVIMPKGSGKEPADRIQGRWPKIQVLFMSGYAHEATTRVGVPGPGTSFIQKSFSPEQLAGKVRDILETGGTSS